MNRSTCCKADLKIEGDKKEGTHYYVCTKCNEPCDSCNISKMEVRFGNKVSVSQKYIRISIRKAEGTLMRSWKIWQPEEYKKENCIFLGYRTLSNGIRVFDSDEGYSFRPREYFKSALICADKKSKPVYVPIESIRLYGIYPVKTKSD